MGAPQAPSEARARLVILGASNAAEGLGHVLRAARAHHGAPLEVLAALGHGRSYGRESSYLFVRRLPGIVGSGLWPALRAAPDLPTHALFTDIGNDLAYGVDSATLMEWVASALEVLEARGATIRVTALPLFNLRRLPAWQFELWRRFLFPTHGVSHARLLEEAERTDLALRERVAAGGHTLVEPREDWYGVDPIHVRRARRAAAWARVVGGGAEAPRTSDPPVWWRLAPERRLILGRETGRPQPCVRLADGTTLSLY